MRVRARDIVRLAKRNGHVFERGSVGNCAVGFLAQTVNMGYSRLKWVGHGRLTSNLIHAIEYGFEGIPEYVSYTPQESRYYKVGRNIFKLASEAGILAG